MKSKLFGFTKSSGSCRIYADSFSDIRNGIYKVNYPSVSTIKYIFVTTFLMILKKTSLNIKFETKQFISLRYIIGISAIPS